MNRLLAMIESAPKAANPLAAMIQATQAAPPELTPAARALDEVIRRGELTSTVGPAEAFRIARLRTADYGTADYSHLERSGAINLRPIQHQALAAIEDAGGGLLPIGVGHGKSFVCALAGTVLGAELAIVFTPAGTVSQLRHTVISTRVHFRMSCRVVVQSYSMLSRPGGTAMIAELAKGIDTKRLVLVFDEGHKIANANAARTKRVKRYVHENPDVRVVVTSGTLLGKSLADLGHLAEWALRDSSPIPRGRDDMLAWARCLDPDGQASGSDWIEFFPLWAATYPGAAHPSSVYPVARRQAMAREAWQLRMRSSPGVVASRAGSLGSSLILHAVDTLEPPEIVAKALDMIEDGEDPAGDPIPDDVTAWRLARNASMGFYYIWDWPGDPDMEWLDARKEWHRCVRAELEHASGEGYDSPFLIASRLQREIDAAGGSFPRVIHRAWDTWAAVKHRPAPPTLAVWLDKYAIHDVATWAARQRTPAIVWYDTIAVADALEAAGMKVYRAGERIPDQTAHTCAASIQSHGTGLNLQAWCAMLVPAFPSSGKVAEQLIGRLHRQGQTADAVNVYVHTHTEPLRHALDKACDTAAFIESTTGNAQKLCFADVVGADPR